MSNTNERRSIRYQGCCPNNNCYFGKKSQPHLHCAFTGCSCAAAKPRSIEQHYTSKHGASSKDAPSTAAEGLSVEDNKREGCSQSDVEHEQAGKINKKPPKKKKAKKKLPEQSNGNEMTAKSATDITKESQFKVLEGTSQNSSVPDDTKDLYFKAKEDEIDSFSRFTEKEACDEDLVSSRASSFNEEALESDLSDFENYFVPDTNVPLQEGRTFAEEKDMSKSLDYNEAATEVDLSYHEHLDDMESSQEHSLLVYMLDELLLDILKSSRGGKVTHARMEKEVKSRTGQEFSTFHDKIRSHGDIPSQGIEDFIDNDSKHLLTSRISKQNYVTADFEICLHTSSTENKQELDLSNYEFKSCEEFVTKCTQARNATQAILRKAIVKDATTWPYGVLDILCWFCPHLREVELTGCHETTKMTLKSRVSHNTKSRIEIIDYLDPIYLSSCSNNGSKLLNLVRQHLIPISITCNGWSLLHSAIFLGNKELLQELLESEPKINVDDNNNGFRMQLLKLAIALHRHEILDLFKKEEILALSASRLVHLCLLSEHCAEFDDNTVKALTFDEEVVQAVKTTHDSQQCDPIQMLQFLCGNFDNVFKRKVIEEIILKVHKTASSDRFTVHACWTEQRIGEAVRLLMKETGRSWNGQIGNFPFMMFMLSSLPLLELFIQNEVNIDKKDHSGCTALFHAIERAIASPLSHRKRIIELLLDNGADPNIRDVEGKTPLHHSLSPSRNSCELCSSVISTDAASSSFDNDQAVEVWRLLLEKGARAKAKDENDRSPLHLLMNLQDQDASRECSTKICEGFQILCEHGGTINARDNEGNTPLHAWAGLPEESYLSNEEFCRKVFGQLISCTGAVNARNDKGETPLHHAQTWLQVELLLRQGAEPNAQALDGNTPLHSFVGRVSLVTDRVKTGRWKKCVSDGMNPWCKTNVGKCAFQVVLDKGFFKTALNLLKATLEHHAETEIAESARCYKDQAGNSLLHVLCNINDNKAEKICQYLLESKFEVDSRNDAGQTALLSVCCKAGSMTSDDVEQSSYPKMVHLLRKYHADVNIPDASGSTCDTVIQGNECLLKLLQEDIQKVQIQPIMKRVKCSVKHEKPLVEIQFGTNSRTVENYHHHEATIGTGTFSSVFPALDNNGCEVALKRIEKVRLEENGALLKREVQCLIKLSDCPKVVNYIGCFADSSFQYIVMELMEGTLDDCDLSSEDAFTTCVDVATGIEYLHSNEIIHRDLKPQNILYKTNPFMVKIGDFGLSKIRDPSKGSESGTVMHSRAGTRCWKAPELLTKKSPKHSNASDIFSCGLLFHYVLAKKKHPFVSPSDDSSLSPNAQETEKNIASNKTCFCPSLTPEALQLLTRMLSVAPRKRPAASSFLSLPFFWDDRRKVQFLVAVGNQIEFEEPRSRLKRQLSVVEKQLERANHIQPKPIKWEIRVQKIFNEVTSRYKGRAYDTTSVVELVRFIRNSHTHCQDLPEIIKELLLKDFVYLKYFPSLVTDVHKAVSACEDWKKRKDLDHYFARKY